MQWTSPLQQQILFLQFCKLCDLNSFVTFVIYKCNDIRNEDQTVYKTQVKGLFYRNSKVHHIECTSSLLIFIFHWLARFYPQCIMNWQLGKGLLKNTSSIFKRSLLPQLCLEKLEVFRNVWSTEWLQLALCKWLSWALFGFVHACQVCHVGKWTSRHADLLHGWSCQPYIWSVTFLKSSNLFLSPFCSVPCASVNTGYVFLSVCKLGASARIPGRCSSNDIPWVTTAAGPVHGVGLVIVSGWLRTEHKQIF